MVSNYTQDNLYSYGHELHIRKENFQKSEFTKTTYFWSLRVILILRGKECCININTRFTDSYSKKLVFEIDLGAGMDGETCCWPILCFYYCMYYSFYKGWIVV